MDLRISIRGKHIFAVTLFVIALMLGQLSARATSAVTVGGPFTLTAPDGATVTDQTYRGKWLLVYFGYRSCPDSCPTALFEIATALRKLGRDAAMLQPIFITIDPQRDTPEVMGEYTQSFDPRIVGLTGTAQQIDAVSNAYGAYFVRRKTGPGAQDYLMDHSIYIYLMSPQGEFVRGFDTSWSGDRIAAAVREATARFHDESASGRTAQMRQ
jgi:protein SCO1/2